MLKRLIIYVLLFSSVFTQNIITKKISPKKMLNNATEEVEKEKKMFLKHFGLKSSNLYKDAGFIKSLMDTHDELVVKEIKEHALSNNVDKQILSDVEGVAQKVFNGFCKEVKIFNDSSFSLSDVGVMQYYSRDVCYVTLNVIMHSKDLKTLEEILRHELSHIVFQDNLNAELIQAYAWINSNVSREEIAERSYAFHRAYERRADVYTLVTSDYNAQYFIDFLKELKPFEEVTTHDQAQDRVIILENLKTKIKRKKARN